MKRSTEAIALLTLPWGVWYSVSKELEYNHPQKPERNMEMQEDRRQDALKRLSYIEGHVTGIRKMVEDDKYWCAKRTLCARLWRN
jgi:Metal-sensitive transcriptional repressor